MATELVLATNNAHKVSEIKEILGPTYQLTTLAEEGIAIEIEETGSTFAENALIKASTIARLTGKAALADDSGLMVEALGGAPGVYSARYAGPDQDDEANIAKLLAALADEGNRKAKFVSAVTVCYTDGHFVAAEGEAQGVILTEKRGAGGFGYDPVFFSGELGKTFAEAASAEKNAISHRKRALEELAAKLIK